MLTQHSDNRGPTRDLGVPGLRLSWEPRWLTLDYDRSHHSLSWAIVGGWKNTVNSVEWCQVDNAQLGPEVDPLSFLRQQLSDRSKSDCVGLLTSCDVSQVQVGKAAWAGLFASCVATVGLSNAVRVGSQVDPLSVRPVQTINLVCTVSAPLRPEAMLEAMSIACEARTAAIVENMAGARGSASVTGTGTDVIVIAAPATDADPFGYAGKHTPLGHVVGKSTYQAIRAGVESWKQRNL